jgi:hypothetical protein
MLKKLDPTRKGMIWGYMTADERGFFDDARDAGATIYVYDCVWSRHDGSHMSLPTAYWTDWEDGDTMRVKIERFRKDN